MPLRGLSYLLVVRVVVVVVAPFCFAELLVFLVAVEGRLMCLSSSMDSCFSLSRISSSFFFLAERSAFCPGISSIVVVVVVVAVIVIQDDFILIATFFSCV